MMQKEFDERKPEIEKEILAQLRKEGVYAYADVGKKERERWKLPTKKDVRDDKLKGSGKKMKRRRGEDTEDGEVISHRGGDRPTVGQGGPTPGPLSI